MFTSSAESFRMAGMTDTEKYNYFDAKAKDVYDQLQTATDPSKIRDLATQLNAYLNSAFALLSPEDKTAKGGAFAARADEADKISQARLAEAQAKAEAEAKALSGNIQTAIATAMDKVAAAMQAAATEMKTAADKMVVVANTPVTTTTTVVVTGRVTVELESERGQQTIDVGLTGISGAY